MYIPKNSEMTEAQAISALISDNSFGVLISADLTATHLPFIYESDEGDLGCLYGHFAAANPHWKALGNQRVLVIFSGPHSYISPTWYRSKPAVPTWNYAAVHCYGTLLPLNDEENGQAMNKLVEKYEPELLDAPDVMPADYQSKLRQAVVGFKIVVDEIHAKEKLGQHRKTADQEGVFTALNESDHADATALALYMQKRKLGAGD